MKQLETTLETKLARNSDLAKTDTLREKPLTPSDLAGKLFLLCRNLQSQALCVLPAQEAATGHAEGLPVVIRDNTGAVIGLPLVQGG